MGWWIKLIYFMNKETYYYYLYYLFMLLFSTLCRLKVLNYSLFLPLSHFPLISFHFGLTYNFYSIYSHSLAILHYILSLSVALFLCLSSWSSLAHLLIILYTQISADLKEFDLLKLSRLSPFPLLPLLPSHFSPLLSTLLAPSSVFP